MNQDEDLTFSQGLCLLHGMNQQTAFSIHSQDWTSCMPCQPTSDFYGESSAYDRLPYRVSSCIKLKPHYRNVFSLANQSFQITGERILSDNATEQDVA